MQLAAEWKQILKHTWSIRWIVAAFFFSGAEFAIQYIDLPFPPGVLAGVGFFCTGAAFVARIVAQKKLLGKLTL